MLPKISVIILCYNQENYIAECLDSVLSQTFDDYEVLVIDDGSIDGSVRIIEEYVKKYSNIKLIKQKNLGVIAARNNAIKQAKGKYIYTLDGDDLIAKTTLEKSFNAIEKNKGDIISSKIKSFTNISEIDENITPDYSYKPTKYNMLANCCISNSALFRKTDFERCGGYDPLFKHGCEDYDLWLNMIVNHNLNVYRIPELLFYYRMKNSKESRNLQAKEYTVELDKLLRKKYPVIGFAKFWFNFKRFIFQRKITKSNKLITKICKIVVHSKKLGG